METCKLRPRFRGPLDTVLEMVLQIKKVNTCFVVPSHSKSFCPCNPVTRNSPWWANIFYQSVVSMVSLLSLNGSIDDTRRSLNRHSTGTWWDWWCSPATISAKPTHWLFPEMCLLLLCCFHLGTSYPHLNINNRNLTVHAVTELQMFLNNWISVLWAVPLLCHIMCFIYRHIEFTDLYPGQIGDLHVIKCHVFTCNHKCPPFIEGSSKLDVFALSALAYFALSKCHFMIFIFLCQIKITIPIHTILD